VIRFLISLVCLVGITSSAFGDITTDGTIIENQTITSQITIKANNCIIRNCYIDVGDGVNNGSWYGIHARNYDSNGNPFTGNLIENCEIQGSRSKGIIAHYTTIRRNNIHDVATCAMEVSSGCVVERNWCHHIGMRPDAHADCIQIRGGNNNIIRYNFFDIPISQTGGSGGYKSNAAIFMQAEVGDIYNINIHHNRVEGGNYTVVVTDQSGFTINRVKIHDNLFGPDYRYGPLSVASNPKQRRISIDRNYWFDGTFMDINTWDGVGWRQQIKSISTLIR